MCYMTKCPYVPPHEWNVDFPHLMLRAKFKRFEDGKTSARDKILSSTDAVGSLAGIPVVAEAVNAFNGTKLGRALLEKTLGVDTEAPVPKYHSNSARRHARARRRFRDLLRQSQPSVARGGSRRGPRAQRDRRRADGP
jgi:hypothetical protein